MIKECRACKLSLPLDSFNRDSKKADGRQSYCKVCRAFKVRTWKKNNPDAYKAINRKAQLKAKYGIGSDVFENLLSKQNHRCAICGTSNANHNSHQWCIDHCHTTGKIRGLLCSNCNLGLGHFKDSILFLSTAINYLESNQ